MIHLKNKIRLNLFISKYSSYSRRQADALIKSKNVTVNGHLTAQIGSFIDLKKDHVKIKGKLIKPFFKPIYIAFNKPEKVLTTSNERTNRATVYHYLKKVKYRVFPVGRLDWNTEGLLLFTNDGVWAQKIIKPKNKIHKTYLAKLNSTPKPSQLEKLKRGVSIPGGHVRAVHIQQKKDAWVQITIQEGKNKQLHHMFNKIGFSIKRLKRTAIGKLKLRSIKKGQAIYLTDKDKNKVFQNFLTFSKRKKT